MTTIPIINMEFGELKEVVWTKLQEPKSQRKLILVIVSIALLLDNMLYMVIVPIIPDYLKYVGAFGDEPETNSTVTGVPSHHGQDSATGILFASKAIVQLMVNPFSGALIDRIGYDIPMMIGLTIMFLSTAVFACGRSYGVLFFARSLQGVGSAFADTAGLAMIADRFTEEAERSKALGIALAFISFGCLVAPPFGGALYQFAGKEMPFLILAFVSLADGFMLLLVMKPLKEQLKDRHRERSPTIPIWRLFIDPYIAVCAGALMMSNVALAFLEPTISLWMEDHITRDNWKMGMIWLPAFFPHVFGVIITVKMAKRYPQHQWLMAAGGLALEGLCCFIIPFSTSYKILMIPICGICFGIALIDTALLPTLGYLVDVRYVSVYGSIYAIADISYSVAYAVGPIIAGGVVEAIGFTALNIGIAFSNLLYAPVLYYLRHIYDFKPFQDEANVLMQDPPDKEYQTYVLQEQRPVSGEVGNHLTQGRTETNIDQGPDYSTDQYNQSQTGYNGSGYNQSRGYEQQQSYGQQPTSYGGQSGFTISSQAPQQQSQPAYGQQRNYGQPEQSYGQQPSFGQQQQPQSEVQGDANPFRRPVEPEKPAGDSNPFRQEGWRDSVLGAPRRLLVSLGSFSRTASPCTGKEDLPKLPVPDLESTMQKYLAQVEVIAPSCLEKSRALVKSFVAGPGPKLQQRLLDRRDQTINWATDWWLKDMYLASPVPLPINSNPGFVFEPKKFSNQNEAATFLARFLNGLFDYQELADRGELQVDRIRSTDGKPGQPMCMAQQYKLFSKYRRPGREFDQQLILDRATSGNHVIVVNHNQFYSVPVRASDRGRLTEAELAQQILKIMEIPADPRTPPVGVLTTATRPFWAAAREELVKNEKNRHNLELLERCLCIVCLDDDVLPTTFNDPIGKSREVGHWIGDRDETNLFHHALHGGGSRHLGANRWYDKTLQLFLGKDGIWGMNYEHSAAEAPAVLGIIETLENQIAGMSPAEESTIPCHLPFPEKLEWSLTEQSMNDIRDAMTSFDAMVEDLDLCVFRFTEYNRDFIKSCKISPDAYIQLVLQLTYFRLHGKLVATYESAGLRRFALGRVDCIRSASVEALEWAKAMCQGDPSSQPPTSGIQQEEGAKRVQFTIYSDQKIRQLFDLAVKRQTKEMNDNIAGHGIDNHLMGLREAAKESGDPLPEIFTDEACRLIHHFALSTSQITTVNEVIAGYGPVVPDGYGCAYNFRKNGLIFYISAFHSDGRTNTSRFAQALDCSLRATAAMLQNPQK